MYMMNRHTDNHADLDFAGFRAVFDHGHDAMLLTIPDGRILAANHAASLLYGGTEAEICAAGREWLVDEGDPRFAAFLEERARTGRAHRRFTQRRLDGSPFEGETSSVVYADRDGNPRTSIIVRDVTERARIAEALGRQQRQFQALVEHTPDVIARLDRQLRHLYANPAVERVTSIPAEDFVGKTNADLGMPAALVAFWDAKLLNVFATGEETAFEFSFPGTDGVHHYYHTRVVPEDDADGAVASVLCISRDITESKGAEAALRESEERYRTVIESLHEGVVKIGADGRVRMANTSAARILGRSIEEIMAGSASDPGWWWVREDGTTVPIEERPTTIALRTGVPQKGIVIGLHKPDDELTWMLINAEPLFRDGASTLYGVVTSFIDITAQKRREHRLHHKAMHDGLTGLPNRAALEEELQATLADARRSRMAAAVLFVDLDGFKRINDRDGHAMGDLALQLAAERLRDCVRAQDIVARYGGDEFVVVLPEVADEEDAIATAERIDAALRAGFAVAGEPLALSATIGIALYPRDGGDARRLLNAADFAMYRAKRDGWRQYLTVSEGARGNR